MPRVYGESKMGNLRFRVVAVCTMAVITAALCQAQSASGNVTGTIYDPSGATVAGATVKITNEETGVTASTESTSAGQYRVPDLRVGTYTIQVSASGFASAELGKVTVILNQTVTANVTLPLERTATRVEVSTAAA